MKKRPSGRAAAVKAGLVPIQLLVTEEMRNRCRIVAAVAGCSMAAYARQAVEAAIEADEKLFRNNSGNSRNN